MKKYRAHGVHARSRFTARHERGREADLANTALTSNTRAQVPPPSSDRPLLPPTLTLPRLRGRKGRGVCHEARLIVEIDVANMTVRRGEKRDVPSSWKSRATASCGSGTTSSSRILKAFMPRLPSSWPQHPHPTLPLEGGGLCESSGAAALDAGVGAAVFVEEFGQAFEHDPAQLLGVDDRHGAAVIAGHVMADADRGQLDLAGLLDVADHLAQVFFEIVAGVDRQRRIVDRRAVRDHHQD